MPRATRTVLITNDLGVHLRAAGALVQLASKFKADLWIDHGTRRANAKSIMSVLTLAASRGVEVTIVADGDDAETAASALEDLINRGFETA